MLLPRVESAFREIDIALVEHKPYLHQLYKHHPRHIGMRPYHPWRHPHERHAF